MIRKHLRCERDRGRVVPRQLLHIQLYIQQLGGPTPWLAIRSRPVHVKLKGTHTQGLKGGHSVLAVAAAQYGDLLISKVIWSRLREKVQLWDLGVRPVDEVVAKHRIRLAKGLDGDAEENEVSIRADDLGRQGQTLGFRACRAAEGEVREDWRAGGAESHRDGQAGTRLGRGGGGVAAGADLAKEVEYDGAWDIVAALALAARKDGSCRHGF